MLILHGSLEGDGAGVVHGWWHRTILKLRGLSPPISNFISPWLQQGKERGKCKTKMYSIMVYKIDSIPLLSPPPPPFDIP
jgi:hypothetical protein